jgi:hypothetical protein
MAEEDYLEFAADSSEEDDEEAIESLLLQHYTGTLPPPSSTDSQADQEESEPTIKLDGSHQIKDSDDLLINTYQPDPDLFPPAKRPVSLTSFILQWITFLIRYFKQETIL